MATQPTDREAGGAPERSPHGGPSEDRPGSPPVRTGRDADRLLLGALRHSAGRTTAICLLSCASAAAAVALPAVLGRTLDLALDSGDGPDGGAGLPRWLALCALLVAAEVLCDAATAYLTGVTGARSTAWLRRRGLGHLLSVGPHRAARFTSGDLVTRLAGNAAEAGHAPATAAGAFAALVTPLGALAALLLIDPWLAAAFCAGVPLLVLLLRAFARSSSESVSHYQRVQGRIAAHLVEALAGARTVAAAGTAGRERARVLAPLPELSGQGRRMWQVYGRAVVGSGVLVPLLTAAVLAVGGVRLAAGAVSVGELLAASRYASLAAGIGGITTQLSSLVRSRAAARRAAELLAVPPVEHGGRSLPPDGTGRLELRGVTAVRGGRTVLRDVDLTVPGGTTVAVVGASGSGKSTLAALAGRLADPDEGEVLLDGVPLAGLDPGVLRREVGYAFERPALFGATVGEAIGFGPREVDDRAVARAARAASADVFVNRLPAGYGTALADAPLSGGEFQRLGLARAFAHAGRLLILDDATSSLDSVTELQVGRALTREVRAGTRLLVAHRVSSAARADLVAWLADGRVRAVGPHEALWEIPEYRAVFAAGEADADGAAADPAGTAAAGEGAR
ncbi:ABC transporter ATP-binding protein [Streptomyces carminius]|uniref:ABC transporter ATP-binding protein n=1 Tax=Streptomyces carminius TaxID=2665496 RepID=A0A2M8LR61_9ACTN|nr:ABC transporter ATP-binding protein [Streptomyces carminius]PJE94440.1 ABC transporter ATP-binding protein [Streptomyces carminius]